VAELGQQDVVAELIDIPENRDSPVIFVILRSELLTSKKLKGHHFGRASVLASRARGLRMERP